MDLEPHYKLYNLWEPTTVFISLAMGLDGGQSWHHWIASELGRPGGQSDNSDPSW